MYQAHEKEKKTKYLHRVIEVEKSSFTPFVISTTGGMAPEADAFLKRLSQKLSTKLDQSYSNTVGYLRRKLRIELLKTVSCRFEDFGNQKQSTYLIWILIYCHITSNEYSLFLGFHLNFCLEFVY